MGTFASCGARRYRNPLRVPRPEVPGVPQETALQGVTASLFFASQGYSARIGQQDLQQGGDHGIAPGSRYRSLPNFRTPSTSDSSRRWMSMRKPGTKNRGEMT